MEGTLGPPLDKITIDAQTFADWKVDMLKFDGCYSNATEQEQGEEGRRVGGMSKGRVVDGYAEG